MLAKAALLAGAALIASLPSHASSYKVIHSFCAKANCSDGSDPMAPVTADAAGNLYGVTWEGGAKDKGVVFRLAKTAKGFSYSVLYSFCAQKNCADGGTPGPEHLVLDTAGNLYGTNTSAGGGTVFKLSPDMDPKKRWHLTTLHAFCANPESCADGNTPFGTLSYAGSSSGALYDGTSPLYGTTLDGGQFGGGVAFALTPDGAESVLYAFCARGGQQCSDGAAADGNILLMSSDKLIGTTAGGGDPNEEGGVVFELDRNGSSWSEKVLHTFCEDRCTDGKGPNEGGLTMDASGNIYGAADYFGTNGHGTAFKLTPAGGSYNFSTTFQFCQDSEECLDGSLPNGSLLLNESGRIFGTTATGGNRGHERVLAGDGVIYSLRGDKMHILYKFCAKDGCPDGELPNPGLIADSDGHLFGTGKGGGAYGGGVIY